MGVVLQVFVEVHLHVVAVSAEVVACQVHEHHVFSVFLCVVSQIFRSLSVSLCVAGALCRSCNGVNESLASFNAAVGLGRRAEDAEAAEVEVEEVG